MLGLVPSFEVNMCLATLQRSGDVNPEQAVALGAALHCGAMLGLVPGLEVMDGAFAADLHGRASGFQTS
jgi:hypothetical protein